MNTKNHPAEQNKLLPDMSGYAGVSGEVLPKFARKYIWFLDVALITVSILALLTHQTVLFFHMIFLILTFGAFFWNLRGFVWRASLWVTISTIIVALAVFNGQTQTAELIEIPLMSFILVVVFLIARQRTIVEESLRRSEKEYYSLYNNLFRNSGEAIFVTDCYWNITAVNQVMQDMLGFPEEELLEKNFETSFLIDIESESLRRELNERGIVRNIELTLRKKNGLFMYCLFTANIWHSPENEILGYQGIIRDITARKERAAELETLLKAEHEQRLLAETLGEVFLSLTSHTNHEAVLDEILSQAQHVLPYSAANIALVANKLLVVSRQQGYEAFADKDADFDFNRVLVELPLDAIAIQTQRPVVIENTRQHHLWVTIPETDWIQSSIMVPICLRQKAIGLLRLDSDVAGRFSKRDIDILQPLARAAAIALENSRLFEQTQQELAERKQIAQELQKLAAKNQAIWDILPDSLFHVRRDGLLLDYKLAGTGVLQEYMSQLRHNSHIDNMRAPGLRSLFRRYIDEAISTRDTQIFEYKLLPPHPARDFEIWLVASGPDEVFAIVRDVTERKAKEAAVQEERTRIARDLHDSLGNNLAYLILKLGILAEKGAVETIEQIQTELAQLRNTASDTYDVMRNILAASLPSNATDFANALLIQAKTVGERAGFNVTLSTKGQTRPLTALLQQQLLYLFTEALTNVEKHAAARNVNLGLVWTDTTLTASLSDDGCGFPEEVPSLEGHFGLNIMQQRAIEVNGQLNLTSKPGEGTEIVIRLPLAQTDPAFLVDLEEDIGV